MLKRPTITDYQSAESEQLMKRLRPGGHGVDEVIFHLHLENTMFLDFVCILVINHAYAGYISCPHPSTCVVSG